MDQQVTHIYEFGPFRVDSIRRVLQRDGQPLPLAGKTFDTLLALLKNRGQTVEKDTLMDQVWAGSAVEESNLTHHISALRKVLGDSPDEHRYVITVSGRGYRFVGSVKEFLSEEADPIGPHSHSLIVIEENETNEHPIVDNEAETPSDGAVAIERKAKWQTGTVLRFLLVAVVLVVLTFTFYALFFRANRPTPLSPINSIVVLPLDNLSGDPKQEYFADGMTDAVIGELARIRSLRVISRTSAIHYRGTNKTLPEIARELKVEAVVEGTVLRFGDRVQVRVQLIRAANDQHLWSETYDYDLRDVLTLQSEVARAVAHEIQIKITPDEQARLTKTRPVNRKAYDDYLLGVYHWNRRSEGDLHKAIDYFQSAIREDATYAPAYAGLADCYVVLASPFSEDPRECYPKAMAYVTKAVEIDGTLAEAHTTLASVINLYQWDRPSAEQEYKRAIELDAGNSTAHLRYARFLAQEGRIEESLVESRRALESDPVSLIVNTSFGFRLYNARRYTEAEKQLMKALDLDPNFFIARLGLGEVYAQTGRYAESLAELNKAAGLSRIPALGALGYAYAVSGRRTEALRMLAELHEVSRRHYVSPADVAAIYTGLGDRNQAFNWLEKAYQERTPNLLFLNMEPKFDSLRKDSRFDDLVRRIRP